EPRANNVDASFDALAELVKQCHSGEPKIEVHCWVVGYLSWAFHNPPLEPEHVFNRHPEFFTRDAIGQKNFADAFYLDPGHPGTSEHLLTVAKDIVSHYDIDGLHWDYLRYPGQHSGYNEIA